MVSQKEEINRALLKSQARQTSSGLPVRHSVEQITRDFQARSSIFDNHPDHFRALECIVEENISKVKITRCVCLGLGNVVSHVWFTPQKGSPRDGQRSMNQLVILMKILTLLRKTNDIQYCYIQDPTFSKVEREFFQSLGFTILFDPEAFSKITTSTLVFAPFANRLILKIFEKGPPAVFIGTGLANEDKYAQAVWEKIKDGLSPVVRMPELWGIDQSWSDMMIRWWERARMSTSK